MLAILGKLKLKITTPEREEGEEKVTYLKEKIAAIQDSLRKQLMVAVLSTELYLCDRDAAQISKLNVGYLFDSSRDVTEIRAPLRSLGNRFGIRKDAILLLEVKVAVGLFFLKVHHFSISRKSTASPRPTRFRGHSSTHFATSSPESPFLSSYQRMLTVCKRPPLSELSWATRTPRPCKKSRPPSSS